MNAPTKNLPCAADSVAVDDHVSFARMARGVWQRTGLVAALIAATVLLTVAWVLVGPATYEATAVVQVGVTPDEPTDGPSAAVPPELVSPEIQETRLLQSWELARQVVDQLKWENSNSTSSITAFFNAVGDLLPIRYNYPSAADRATKRLLNGLIIKNEARSALITVSYRAKSPEEAAKIVNAVVAEYVRMRRLKRLATTVARERAALERLALVYGDNHPSIKERKAAIEKALMEYELHKASAPPSEFELVSSENVIPARAVTVPVGLSLGAALVVGLVGGLTIAFATAFFLEFARDFKVRLRLLGICSLWPRDS